MDEQKKYWPANDKYGLSPRTGFELSARAEMAFHLLSHFGIVSAREQGEDSAGRQKITLLTPIEAVARAFGIADAFVDACEERGDIREYTTKKEI